MGYTIKLLDSEGKANTYEGVEKIGLQTADGSNTVYFHARYKANIEVDDGESKETRKSNVCNGVPFNFIVEARYQELNTIEAVITCGTKAASNGDDFEITHCGGTIWVVSVEGEFITGDLDIKIKLKENA